MTLRAALLVGQRSPSNLVTKRLELPRTDGGVSIAEDVEDFVRLHQAHGMLTGDATEPTLTGHRVKIRCPCSATFVRHVTAGEAAIDLAILARRD
jgi:hypothetical protein